MALSVESVMQSRSTLGEGAVRDDRAGCLWWVDIPPGLIHRYDPASGANETWEWGEALGCVAVREKGGLLLATRSGFHFFDPETGERQALADPEADQPENRFNDGTTDMQGRFWAGTMKHPGDPARTGQIYRFDPDQRITPFHGKMFTPNGMAFSPDGRRMYFSDSYPEVRMIWQADYDPDSGTPGKPELFFDTRAVAGRPDGATIDADGCYWMAGVSGWQIVRITPRGKVDRIIDMPVERPSKPMFGGARLDTLYVTTIGTGLTPGREQPLAGDLFAITGTGTTGLPQTPFAG